MTFLIVKQYLLLVKSYTMAIRG